MEVFKDDIDSIFSECADRLLWYLNEYNLDLQKMEKIFTDYISNWFDTILEEQENEFDM